MQLIDSASTIETRNDEIRKELEVIASRKRGLNPSTLLEVAKNPRSTLHAYFTWDDTEAAQRWREAQAYDLIRRIRVTITPHEGRQINVRAFFPVKKVEADGTIDGGKRGNYLPIVEILQSDEATRQLIANAKRELASFSTKYRQLSSAAEMKGLFDEISNLLS